MAAEAMAMTDQTIQPIETIYRGYRFRSRLEARWAVFFDAAGIEWVYEPDGFIVNGRGYLPDFWLPQFQCFVEVKPNEETASQAEPLLRRAFPHSYRNRCRTRQHQHMPSKHDLRPFRLHAEADHGLRRRSLRRPLDLVGFAVLRNCS
jgi:hypothetical protein